MRSGIDGRRPSSRMALAVAVLVRAVGTFALLLVLMASASALAKSVDAGDWHSCAVTDSGRVQCWGYLGDLVRTGAGPIDVPGFDESVREVATGTNFSCAITVRGELLCWGRNDYGQIGSGSDASSVLLPAPVVGLGSGVRMVAAGQRHACAVTQAGGVMCWGLNKHNALGVEGIAFSPVPVPVQGLASGVVSIDVGYDYACAVLGAGKVKCWGAIPVEFFSPEAHAVPQEVSGFERAVASVAVAKDHACGIDIAGVMACWGYNVGLFVDGPWANFHATPTPVTGLPAPVTAMTTTALNHCAVVQGGVAYCWGWGGRLGDGTTEDSWTPKRVLGIDAAVTGIATGDTYSCAQLETGALRCWGFGDWGQLGNGVPTYHSLPVHVIGLDGSTSSVSTYDDNSCSISVDGRLDCWGPHWTILGDGLSVPHNRPGAVTDLGGAVRNVAVGLFHACAAIVDGAPWCWGSNSYGQLGDGSELDRLLPVRVNGLADVDIFALGFDHSCALTRAGSVWCWGAGHDGQLGNDGYPSSSREPVQPLGLESGVRQIATGYWHTCAVTESGALFCWGDNGHGQLGDNAVSFRTVPSVVTGFESGVLAVSANYSRTCALKQAGAVWCWGEVNRGEDNWLPTRIAGLSADVVAISVGAGHACALTARGSLECWGDNEFGQLGHGTRTDARSPPVEVLGATSPFVSVSAGYNHVCATTAAHDALCWGVNYKGSLGNGEARWSLTAAPIVEIPASLVFRSGFE